MERDGAAVARHRRTNARLKQLLQLLDDVGGFALVGDVGLAAVIVVETALE